MAGKMEELRGTEEEDEELEEDLLPHKHMKQLEEQTRIIRRLYKDVKQEQEQYHQRDHQPLQQQQQRPEPRTYHDLQTLYPQQQQQQQIQHEEQEWHELEQPFHEEEHQWGPWQQEYKPLVMKNRLGDGELHLLSDPLALTPDLTFDGRRRITATEDEEEEDDDEMDDAEMKGLMPPRETTEEVEKQNRIIFSIYEDSLQSIGGAGVSGVSSSRVTGASAVSEHSAPHIIPTHVTTTAVTFPSSSTPSLAPECGGGAMAMRASVHRLLAQDTSPHKALQLNLALQQVFRATIAKLEEALKKNLSVQAEATDALESTGLWLVKETLQRREGVRRPEVKGQGQRLPFMYAKFCVPYFKDGSGMSAPMNEDGKKKVDVGYLDLYTIKSRLWITREQLKVRAEVEREWKKQLMKKAQQNLKDEERQLKTLAKGEVNEEAMASARKKIEDAMTELTNIEETDADKLTLPPRRTPFDWEQIAAQAFDGQRSATECQLMWDNLLHPWVNRGAFTEEEDLAIQSLVRSTRTGCNNNDWEAIAKRLGTKRTGYLVMQRWVTFLGPNLHPAKWNIRDTKKLIDAVSLLRKGEHIPWSQVHQHLPGYTRAQVYSHWRAVNPERSTGHFTAEEDTVLVKGLYLFGPNFTKVAHFLPGRSYSQVKDKFRRSILPTLTTKPWTRQEDRILLSRGEPSQGSSRKLIWYLPRRIPIQSRCRFIALKLWHSLTGDNKSSPPPLFPLTDTTDKNKIEDIRSLLVQEALHNMAKVQEVVGSNRKEINNHPVLQELKDARVALQESTSCSVAERMQRLVIMRGNQKGCRSWEPVSPLLQMLYDRFFEPARVCDLDFPASDEALTSLKVLSEVMLLKPRPKKDEEEKKDEKKKKTRGRKRKRKEEEKEEEEEEEEEDETQMTKSDLALWKKLVAMWEEEEEEKRAKEQDAERTQGSGVDSDEGGGGGGGMREGGAMEDITDMPLIPPNLTTLSSLHSLLLHLPVLTEMAVGDFILHNFSFVTLANMKESQRKASFFKQNPTLLQARARARGGNDGEEEETESEDEEEKEEEERMENSRKAPDTANTPASPPLPPPLATSSPSPKRHRVPSDEENNAIDSEDKSAVIKNRTTSSANARGRRGRGSARGNRRRSAITKSVSANVPSSDPMKIHITSKANLPKWKKKQILEDITSPQFSTYSKGQPAKMKSEPGKSYHSSQAHAATSTTTTTSHPEQDTATPSTSLGDGNDEEEMNSDEKAARDKADKLLFQRMMSLFLWPSMMMRGSPTVGQMRAVEQKAKLSENGRIMSEEEEEEEEEEDKQVEKTVQFPKKSLKRRGSSKNQEEEKAKSVERMAKQVEELKKMVRQDLAKKQELKMKMKSSEKKQPPPGRKRGRKRKRLEEPDTVQPQSPKEEERQPPPPSPSPAAQNTEEGLAEEEAQAGSSSESPTMKAILIDIARKKNRLSALNRSYQMKKLWEKRRQGKVPQRKQKGESLKYKPRGTRSRGRGQQEAEENDNNNS